MILTKAVGKSFPRLDGPETVSDTALYTADVFLPSTLHAKLFRSSIPHGRIRRLDLSRAIKLKGVVAIVTAADLAGRRFGSAIRDEEIFAGIKVRFSGDAIAAVAAEDPAAAEEALDRIDCEYEELPAVLTADEALRENASLVHEHLETYQFNPIMARKWNPVPGTNIAHQTSSEPFGAKGVGEVSLFGVAPAIANAIARATGVRINELPITAEKVLEQLKR
jgi:carbon-monoxide dehydrogenase large subunit